MKRAALTLLVFSALYAASSAQQAAGPPGATTVTFTKDVAPILQKS